jgi:hypothetical protein
MEVTTDLGSERPGVNRLGNVAIATRAVSRINIRLHGVSANGQK